MSEVWECPECGEKHETTHDACWRCGAARGDSPLAERMVKDASAARVTGSPQQGPFQFGLQSLFVVTTLVACICAMMFTTPPLVQYFFVNVLMMALAVVCTIVVIYGRGYVRTFFIGALFPAGVFAVQIAMPSLYRMFYSPAQFIESGAEASPKFAIVVGCAFLLSALLGLLAIATRYCVERSRRPAQGPPPSADVAGM